MVNTDSFDNVEHKWYREVTHCCPNVPYVLVGAKVDMRDDNQDETITTEKVSTSVTFNDKTMHPNSQPLIGAEAGEENQSIKIY